MSDPTVRLVLGDCLEHMAGLSGIDAVVSDPPYGMKWNTDSTRFSGGTSPASLRRGLGRDDNQAVVGDDKPFDPARWLEFPKVILWGSNHYGSRLPVGTTLVWVKRNDTVFGTFLSDAEMAFMKGGHGIYLYKNLSMYGMTRQKVHPTQKPVALMRWCIEKLKLKPGSTILDPYMGSASTGVAAIELGHNFIGFEIDPTHYASATKRINKALADRAELLPLA